MLKCVSKLFSNMLLLTSLFFTYPKAILERLSAAKYCKIELTNVPIYHADLVLKCLFL